ncbi:hypothetical protein BDW74DRAFT_160237 [Aspergillus multicolor]|uniref:uncharacterized protein n=1 Tax=Aspergillus multicolor TaxID=41759 RepID=UPI003CCE4BFB
MFARSFAFRVLAQPCPKASPSPGAYSPNSAWRYFSSSVSRTKAASGIKDIPYRKPGHSSQPKSPSSSEEGLKFAGRRPAGFARLERKVAKEGDLVLYKAPSQRSYILGAYGGALFCFAYAVYNSNATIRDPVIELPKWQKILTGGICIIMSVMGTLFFTRTGRLIKTVKAVSSGGQAHLRFTVRSMAPFRKPFEFDVLPHRILFTRQLGSYLEQRGGQGHVDAQPGSKGPSLLRAPGQAMSRGMYKIFQSIRQVFTQEDFILLEVDGQKGTFRMDQAGYVSDDFLPVFGVVPGKRPTA